jgi:hypothetical protein
MKTNATKEITFRNLLSNQKIQFALIVIFLLLIAAFGSRAQTVNPVKYYTFNGSNITTDSMGGPNLNFSAYGSQYTIEQNGRVGKFITLDNTTSLADGGALTLTNALSVEFLFKPGSKFNTCNFMQRGDNAFIIKMEYAKITFVTNHKTTAGASIEDNFVVELDGIGRKSYGYYMDNNWHHIAFVFNAATGVKEIWVDGQLPAGFSKTIAAGTFQNTGSTTFYLNHSVSYVKYFGSIDELAIYNTAIPASLIYKHYLGIQTGQSYSFLNNYSGSIPAATTVTSGIDIDEYAPGHPSVTVTAVEQMSQFSIPRYKPGHTLMKNYNWMDPKFMGGAGQSGVTNQQAATNGVAIQTEMAKNFNYYFQLAIGNGTFETAWINAANANPDFKLAITVFRGQLNGGNGEVLSQSKTAAHYLQNSSGQFLDVNGNVTSTKIWRPTAPISSYTADGNNTLTLFNTLFTSLNRNIDIVNENGEIFPHITDAAMAKDPDVTAAKNASGLDWSTFLARKFADNEKQAYRDIFMTHPRLANAKFTEYAIDGVNAWRMKYSETRSINSLINGQYYATPDFYPRYPNNWRYWVSSWHGWQWIVESRATELAAGDRLYSPFVSAGWDNNEENNIRPAQWLGLLKCLGMSGAEFYYAGFFSLGAPWPDSKNWVWQAVMPAYAQAVSSRYEEFLRNGDLMIGDVANNYITPTGPGYSFNAGDLRKLVVIRKLTASNKYAITGTVQPNSNMIDNSENESVAKITLAGEQLTFKVRRQGSTYVYDKTNAAAPVFYQLDGWHEKTHPYRWTRDFYVEGELFDNTNTQVSIKTAVPTGTVAGDYTNFTSYVSWPDNVSNPTPVEYQFTPRTSAGNTFYFWVRARSRDGNSTSMNVQVDNTTAKTIGCISDTNWTWYRYDACTQLPISATGLTSLMHTLRITPSNGKLEIDQFLLTTSSTLILNAAPPTCGAAAATITANGNTTFCQGGTVILTANSGTSYLWTPGNQTTQSITVSASGNYNVTVASGAGCSAIATPVTVTVNQPPVATITAGGSTSLCAGGNVTLTASSGASYLWLPTAQTTQSITATTAGTYTVRVTNASGCSTTSSGTTLTVSAAPSANITANGATSFCQGGSVSLSATTASSYLWFPDGQTTQTINASSSGNYSVRVTNVSGCTATSSATVVTVYSNPTAIITAGGPTTFCAGGNVSLTASAGSSYLWTPGGQTTQNITISTAGSYTVKVTNSNGCFVTSASTNIVVNSNPVAIINAGGPTTFCQGSNVVLTASAGNSYLWTPGGLTTSSINVSNSGSYSVKVTNNQGCSSTSSSTVVTVNSTPVATITPSGSTGLCSGGVVDLTASNANSYLWNNGETTQTISAFSGGNYSVTVFNSNGCSATSAPQTVTIAPPVIAQISANGPTSFNLGQTVILSATGGLTYSWIPNGETTQDITVSSSGNYRVTAFDASGCSGTSAPITVSVNVIPAPPAYIFTSGGNLICPGQSLDLTASDGASYFWLPGGETTKTISVTAPGIYSVTVTDSTGAFASDANIQIGMSGVPAAPSISTAYIPNSAYQLTAYEPTAHSYIWSHGVTAASTIISSPGTYSVIAVNNSGCQSVPKGMMVNSVLPQSCVSPDMLSTYNITKTAATLSWNPAITAQSFEIEYTQIATGNSTTQNVQGNISSLRITDLQEGATYKWSVKASCNGVLIGNNDLIFTTIAGSLPCGSTPQGLSTDNVNSTFAKVSWMKTDGDYVVIRYREVGSNTYNHKKMTADTTIKTLLGLTPSTSYEWSMRSICGLDTSLLSAPEFFTTLTNCPSVGAISATEITHQSARILWNASVQVDTIMIRYAVDGTTNYQVAKIAATPNPGMYDITGLNPSTTYKAWVNTKCATGSTSTWGQGVTFTTLQEPVTRNAPEAGIIHLNAYPNPTKFHINYVFESNDEKAYSVTVCDMAGRELFADTRVANAGLETEKISLAGFASGMYMLTIQKGPMVGRFKFNISE